MARSKALEVFKFGVYLAVPIGLSYVVIGDQDLLNKIIRNRSYVVYPPEAQRPPTAEQLSELVGQQQGKNSQRTKVAMAVDKQQSALVVGGAGFVGKELVRQLLADGRFDVTTFDIRDPGVPGARAITGDLRDAKQVSDAIKGMDVVFHCAAITPSMDTEAHRALMREVNVGGTRAVLDACLTHAVPRLVFTSSSSVVYEGQDLVDVDETRVYAARPADCYNETKAQAERMVLSASGGGAAPGGLVTCALRPASVFGEGDPLFVPSLVRNARAGKTKYYIGSGKNMTDFTYVGNIAAAHIQAADALERGGPSSPCAGQAYFITNDEPRLFWGFCGDLLEGLGYRRPYIHMPFWLVYGIALLLKWVIIPLLALLGKQISPSLTPLAIRLSSSNRTFSCAKAKRDFGYVVRTPMDEAARRTIASFPHLRNDQPDTAAKKGK